jgi:hypothetical protein
MCSDEVLTGGRRAERSRHDAPLTRCRGTRRPSVALKRLAVGMRRAEITPPRNTPSVPPFGAAAPRAPRPIPRRSKPQPNRDLRDAALPDRLRDRRGSRAGVGNGRSIAASILLAGRGMSHACSFRIVAADKNVDSEAISRITPVARVRFRIKHGAIRWNAQHASEVDACDAPNGPRGKRQRRRDARFRVEAMQQPRVAHHTATRSPGAA